MASKVLLPDLRKLQNPLVSQEVDFDLEFGDAPQLENFEELENLAESQGQSNSKKTGKNRLNFKADIELDNAVYRGKKTTRASFFNQKEDDNDDQSQETEEGDDEEEDEMQQSDGDQVMRGNNLKTTNARKQNGTKDSIPTADGDSEEDFEESDSQEYSDDMDDQQYRVNENSFSENDDDDDDVDNLNFRESNFNKKSRKDRISEENYLDIQNKLQEIDNKSSESEEGEGDYGDDEHEQNQIMHEYSKIQNEDQSISVLAKERMLKERQKGRAVKSQRTILDRFLVFRIQLQKAIAASNKLPHPSMHQYSKAHNTEVGQLFQDVSKKSKELIGELFSLMDVVASQNKAVSKSFKGVSKKRKIDSVDEIWDEISVRQNSLQKFQDEALDRWHRKSLLQTGKGAMRADTGELHRGISQQVEIVMRDKDRVVKRARLQKHEQDWTSYLCCPSSLIPSQSQENQDVEYDMETYDDSEFYQGLLKEYLEGAGAIAAEQLAVLQKQRKKKTRNVDRKASKGRKLRYTVEEKLVNFLLPEEQEVPQFASQLFKNLFGED